MFTSVLSRAGLLAALAGAGRRAGSARPFIGARPALDVPAVVRNGAGLPELSKPGAGTIRQPAGCGGAMDACIGGAVAASWSVSVALGRSGPATNSVPAWFEPATWMVYWRVCPVDSP